MKEQTLSKRDQLRRLAASPTGLLVRDAASALQITVTAAAAHLVAMAEAGELVRVNQRVTSRYFVSRAAADSFIRLDADSQAQAAQKRGTRARAWWLSDPKYKNAKPIITPQTKKTVAPKPPIAYRTNTHGG
jgi:predicted ArsR family transcriptional regulator